MKKYNEFFVAAIAFITFIVTTFYTYLSLQKKYKFVVPDEAVTTWDIIIYPLIVGGILVSVFYAGRKSIGDE